MTQGFTITPSTIKIPDKKNGGGSKGPSDTKKPDNDKNKKDKKLPPPWPGSSKQENDEKEKHPFGKTHDVPYHHKNSRGGANGGKSPPPQDSQRCLDNSIPYRIKKRNASELDSNMRHRLATEGDSFFLLKYTAKRLFHAHKIPWKKISDTMQNKLIKYGYANSSGKILRQITKDCVL